MINLEQITSVLEAYMRIFCRRVGATILNTASVPEANGSVLCFAFTHVKWWEGIRKLRCRLPLLWK